MTCPASPADESCVDQTPCPSCPRSEAADVCCTDARDADPWRTWVWHEHAEEGT